jgi:hypothetical protein
MRDNVNGHAASSRQWTAVKISYNYYYCSVGIYYSTDYGVSWTAGFNSPYCTYSSIAITDSGTTAITVCSGSSTGACITTNSGYSWNTVVEVVL